jgi:hypothetical protein
MEVLIKILNRLYLIEASFNLKRKEFLYIKI